MNTHKCGACAYYRHGVCRKFEVKRGVSEIVEDCTFFVVKEFEIASNNTGENWIEASLHNLRFRLRLQEDEVAKTKAEIEHFEDLLENNKEMV